MSDSQDDNLDIDLKQQLIKTLEDDGTLKRLQDELNEAVYLAFLKQSEPKPHTPATVGNFLSIDLLESLKLKGTLSVLRQEANLHVYHLKTREQLTADMAIDNYALNNPMTRLPLLSVIINKKFTTPEDKRSSVSIVKSDLNHTKNRDLKHSDCDESDDSSLKHTPRSDKLTNNGLKLGPVNCTGSQLSESAATFKWNFSPTGKQNPLDGKLFNASHHSPDELDEEDYRNDFDESSTSGPSDKIGLSRSATRILESDSSGAKQCFRNTNKSAVQFDQFGSDLQTLIGAEHTQSDNLLAKRSGDTALNFNEISLSSAVEIDDSDSDAQSIDATLDSSHGFTCDYEELVEPKK